MTLKKWLRRVAVLSAVLVVLLALAFFISMPDTEEAEVSASAALLSDADVSVSSDGWQVFRPANQALPRHGLIFYPGGFADPIAYAPLLRELSKAGYLVVNTPAPLNLALLAPDEGLAVMAAFPEIRSWTIAGHSLGGTMAARFAGKYPDRIAGLLLWAAYPMDDPALSKSDLPATSIYGSADTFASVDEIEAGKAACRLPQTTY